MTHGKKCHLCGLYSRDLSGIENDVEHSLFEALSDGAVYLNTTGPSRAIASITMHDHGSEVHSSNAASNSSNVTNDPYCSRGSSSGRFHDWLTRELPFFLRQYESSNVEEYCKINQ